MKPLNRYQQGRLDAAFRRSWREDARAAQKSRCFYCEEPVTARTATADHVQAKAVFGLDKRNNIVAACGHCNTLKGKLPEKSFRQNIEKPVSGTSLHYWLAWSRLRINRRLALMEKRLGVAA